MFVALCGDVYQQLLDVRRRCEQQCSVSFVLIWERRNKFRIFESYDKSYNIYTLCWNTVHVDVLCFRWWGLKVFCGHRHPSLLFVCVENRQCHRDGARVRLIKNSLYERENTWCRNTLHCRVNCLYLNVSFIVMQLEIRNHKNEAKQWCPEIVRRRFPILFFMSAYEYERWSPPLASSNLCRHCWLLLW